MSEIGRIHPKNIRNKNNRLKPVMTYTVTGTPGEITNQLLSIPGTARALQELGMVPSDLANNVFGVIDAMDKGESYRFPSCSSGQGFCNGSGLCTGPACFKDCNKYAPGMETGPGFNWGGGGSFGGPGNDWYDYEWNVGVYQGGTAGMGTTWTCSIGISY